jgi:hypothetical protein
MDKDALWLMVVRPVRLAYQPPASSTFLSDQTSHEQPTSRTFLRPNQPRATSQPYFSLRTNQHQPSATSQTNRLVVFSFFI